MFYYNCRYFWSSW